MDNLLDQKGGVEGQVNLANKIIQLVREYTGDDYYEEKSITGNGKQLLGLLDAKHPDLAVGKKIENIIVRPETSVAVSSLFTGARNEPPMFSELKKEIKTADRIDMLVSFIKWTGLRLILEDLKEFTEGGGQLRIITTSYMGATEVKAIEELENLSNTEIKISYDTNRTRLHAKAYIFYRNTDFITAYVGSSNLSNAAISSGLEWNVKLTKQDQPNNIRKIEATFENYWCTSEFELYTHEDKERLRKAIMAEKYNGPHEQREYIFDVNPYSYQQEILDRLEVERRERGYFKNLVVAATGTGWLLVIFLIAVSIFMSLMFPTIYGLALADIENPEKGGCAGDTKIGASGLIMAILGGAVLTPLQGIISDTWGINISYMVPAICFAVILSYSLYVIRTEKRI